MKKWSKIILIILLFLICIILIYSLQENIFDNSPLIKMKYNNMSATIDAVVIEVYENSLGVMRIGENNSLLDVSFSNEENLEFKQGQEIRIYFDGIISAIYPGSISNVGKIEILKEESDIEIPDDYIRHYESSKNNVSISINEFTPTGITFTITDKNELPYNYSNNYGIYKGVRNEELRPISDIKKEDTVETLVYNLPDMTENDKYTVTGRKFDWTKLYGKLEERKI